jgi:hypothetical protein
MKDKAACLHSMSISIPVMDDNQESNNSQVHVIAIERFDF